MNTNTITLGLLLTTAALGWSATALAKQKGFRRSESASSRALREQLAPTRRTGIVQRISVQAGGSMGLITAGGNNEVNPGLSGGITLDIGRGNFVFETGIVYLEMGVARSLPAASGIDQARLNLNYVAIPLNAKYAFYQSDSVAFTGRIGVLPMLAVSQTGTAHFQGNVVQRINLDELSKNDVAGTLGLGTRIRIGESSNLLIDAGGIVGAIPLNREVMGDTRNLGFSLLTGVSFEM